MYIPKSTPDCMRHFVNDELLKKEALQIELRICNASFYCSSSQAINWAVVIAPELRWLRCLNCYRCE